MIHILHANIQDGAIRAAMASAALDDHPASMAFFCIIT
jgi:hypothetical protein